MMTEATDPSSFTLVSQTEHAQSEDKRKPKRIIRRRRHIPPSASVAVVDPVLLDKVITTSNLPQAYSFEIPKTVQRIASLKAQHVALQMPEGLLLYATVLSDVLKRLCPTLCSISVLGDVTYGACCVDDLDAQALGAELLVHYGHSCLVPLQHTVIPCLYVFVEIQIDVPHLVGCLDKTLHENGRKNTHVYLLGTIQFRHAFPEAKLQLNALGYEVSIPQVKPLSPGEVLGCTSPKLDETLEDAVVCFVADGRFHLESTMICNPHISIFYRYDPYPKTLTIEEYEHEQMKSIRQCSIDLARGCHTFGIILGTLGRQGNPAIVRRIRDVLRQQEKKSFLMLLSEISPAKLQLLSKSVDAWVQVACPRLSVDWGHCLTDKPILTPYELFVCFDEAKWKNVYPMDFYSAAGGPWSNYYGDNTERQILHDH